jgi:hypothetical protein
VHPIVFKGRKTFASGKMFKLYDDENAPNNVVSSVVWQKYVPTQKHVHGYGCRLVSKINDKRQGEGKLTIKNRHIYCGAYHLITGLVRGIATIDDGDNPVKSAVVTHRVEDGEIAHTEIRFILKPEISNIEAAKTEIIDRLWYACCGPLPFICDYDHDIAGHPSENLDPGPLGGYVDTRSRWSRIGDLVIFHVCQWVMGKLGRVHAAGQ